MTLDEFDALLCLHGADLKNWPANQRLAAERFLAGNNDAVKLLKEMEQLDDLVLTATQAQISAGVIVGKLQKEIQRRREVGWPKLLLSPRGLLALGSVGGAGGFVAAIVTPVATDASVLLVLALGGVMP